MNTRTYEYRCPCGSIVRGFLTRAKAEAAASEHRCHRQYRGIRAAHVQSTYTEADYLADRRHRERIR